MSRTYIRNLSSFGYKTPQNSSKGREISRQTGQYTSIEASEKKQSVKRLLTLEVFIYI